MNWKTGFLRLLIEMLARTWRYELVGSEHLSRVRRDRQPTVYALWHGQMLPVLFRHRNQGVALLVSEHEDGGVLAEVARRWGYRVLRGSSTRGQVKGLRSLMRHISGGGEVATTPDGPRGPAGVAKAGLWWAAGRTGAPVVVVGAGASSSWQLSSWDEFLIPRPFAKIRLAYGPPIKPAPESQDDDLSRFQQALERVSELARC